MREFLEEYFSNFFWFVVVILASLLFVASGVVVFLGSLNLLLLVVDSQGFKEAWQTLLWVRVSMIAYVPCLVLLFTVYSYKEK